jgi:hypothetical protein
MTASPQMLIGFMLLLLVFAGLLVVFLIRGRRKKQKMEPPAATGPKAESRAGAKTPDPTPASDVAAFAEQAPATLQLPEEAVVPAAASPEPGRDTPLAPTVAVPPAAPPSETDAVLLMQVWQDRDGFLMVEVEGQRYRRLFDIRDGTTGRRVLEAINRLVAFSKGQESRVDTSSPAAAPATPPFAADPVPFRRQSAAQELNITLNLASEIEQLLQIRVQASPEYRQRYIHVSNAPDGGLRFDVDDAHYYSLDEIPDPQVPALIRAAISDWEAQR